MASTATFTAVFTTAGTYTWVDPSGVTSVSAQCWAGGGGGGDNNSGASGGGGGGGGEYAAELTNSVTAGDSYTVTVGAAGAGGQGGSDTGGTGGNSSFSGTGATTVTAHGGSGGTDSGGSGAAGTGSSNSVHYNGGSGGTSGGSNESGGGGGGSSGGTSSAGNAGGNTTGSAAGAAGTAVTGGGPGGAGATETTTGNAPASGPGGGGGGGGGDAGGAVKNGGAGFAGQVVITWTMNSPAVLSAATTGGTYTWTCPAGITSVSWTISGTATFDGNSSSGSEAVTAGNAYTITVAAGGSLTITWGGASGPVLPYTGGQVHQSQRRKRSQLAWIPAPPVTTSGGFALGALAFTATGNVANPVPLLPYTGGQVARQQRSKRRQQVLPTGVPASSFGLGALGFSGTAKVAPTASGSFKLGALGFSGTDKETEATSGSFKLGALGFAGTAVVAYPFPQYLLPLKYELLVNGTWTDITGYVYQRQSQITTRGRPDETQTVQSTECNLTLNNRDGRFTPGNANGAWYPYLGRNTQLRVSLVDVASATGDVYNGYRFWGETSELPPSWDQTQSDIYVMVTASGVLRRYQQGANIGSALRRYYSGLSGELVPYAAWPVEDASGSTLIASLLSSVDPMSFSGSPDFASATAFGGSDAIAGVNSSSWHGETGAPADPPGTGDIVQVIPGTYTWICPPGVSTVDVEQATGAGGGGGDTDGTTGGSGAGGAGTSVSASVGVTAGTAYTYVVPAAGAAGSGGPGTDGADATWAGDSATVIGHGGAGGGYAGAAGGDGGAGTYSGGDGAAGQDDGPSSGSMTLSGYTGATGTGTGTTEPAAGDSQSQEWVCPPGVDTVAVKAGAAGGGGTLDGGGGAGFSSGSIDTTPGNTYIFQAGNGGNGGSFSGGKYGNDGGDSYVDGDSSSSVTAGGGGGGGFGGAPGSGGSGDNGGASGSSWSYTAVDFEDEAYDQEVSGGGGGGASSGTDGAAPTANTDSPFTFGYTGGVYGGGAGGFWTNFDDLSGGSSAGTSNPGTSAAGGGGGASTPDGTNYTGGLGGGPGWITWSWTGTDVPVGGGGGGSGGTGADGNAGSTEGTGGIAVTGGGAGGGQGSAGSAPGGGGGGAVPAYGPNAAVPAGNGGAGKIAFSWDGGETSPVAADIVRFLLDVPPGGETDGVVLVQFVTYSDDVTTVDVVYHAGGDLELIGYNSSSDQVFDSGSKSFGVDGQPVMVDVQLISDGSDIEWSLSAIEPGAGSAVATYTGTLSGTVLYVSDVYVSPNGDVASSAVGWLTVQTYADPLTTLAQVINGYAGETVAARLERLSGEEGVTFTLVGNADDTPQMGPQQDDTFTNVLQSCEAVDLGQLFEPRDSLGVGYRTRVSLQNQTPVVYDYSTAVLAFPVNPTADDQFTRNDITLTRSGGSSYTDSVSTGPLSTQDPPNGVGAYTYSATVIAYADSQLSPMVTWMLATGTVNELRYPQLTFDLTRSEIAGQLAQTADLDVGDYIQVTRPPSFLTTSNIDQLCWGFTETLNNYVWTIAVNAVPEDPYTGGGLPTW